MPPKTVSSAPVVTVPAADRALVRPARRGLAALAALAVLFLTGALALLDIRPPAPRPASAPESAFSADRAYAHQARIATGPHPAGSVANDAVREHLVATLRDLGLDTSVQDTVGPEAGQLSGGGGDNAAVGRVRNVVASLPGTDPTGRVFLVAHYDSVQTGPGGSDDGAGTSALLEVARALTTNDRLRNDVVFVLTDAEEACLCGAAAFATAHPLAADPAAEHGVVLNLEARGSGGPVIMFETSRDNAGLVDVYGSAAPHPVGTSFAVEIYRLLPNDTDFTPFLDNGFAGLNAAYIDGGARYHTPLDTAAAADRRSLQAHGDNALALARAFGIADLGTPRASGDATYFPAPGLLVRYPAALAWPLAVLALVAVLALGYLVRRAGRTSWPRILAGFGLALAPILVAPAAAQLLWLGVTAIQPGYAAVLDPYRPLLWRLSVLALSAAVLFGWYGLFRRRVGPAALAVGGLLWVALLGLVLAALMSGGSYLAALPALGAALGGIGALLLRGWWSVLAATLGTVVAVLVLVPTVVLLFPALGMSQGGAGAFIATLLGLAALPVLDLLYPAAGGQRGLSALRAGRIALGIPVLALAVALGLAGTAFAVDRFDAGHPVPTHLMYALDADTGTARWVSYDTAPADWTSSYLDAADQPVGEDFPALAQDEVGRTGPAQAATLPAPALSVVSDTPGADGTRNLRVRLVPQRQVRLAALHVDASTATVTSAVVHAAGSARPVPVAWEGAGRWALGLIFHAPPTDGFELELVVRPTTPGGPVRFRAEDGSDGLAGLPGFRPRPPGVGIAGSHTSELALVAKTYTL
jgi:hypothetical protein